jgi:hypothetical protein
MRTRRATMKPSLGVPLAVVAGICAACSATETVTIGGEKLEVIEIGGAGPDAELISYVSSVMGGVRFSTDPTHHLYTRGDTIVVSISDPAQDAAWEAATISLVTQTADGLPVQSVDQLLELMEAVPTATVTPTGTAIEVLGYVLAGYDVRAEASSTDHWIFAADRIGSPASSLFGFTPNGRVFLGETPAGVLIAASAEADQAASIDDIDVALGTLVSTIEFTGNGIDTALPQGNALEPSETEEPTVRGVIDPDGPIPLDAPFSPVAPGTYQLANFGPTFTLEFGARWFVQPNFPGFVVFTDLNSGGPGDRDIVFLTDLADLVRIGPGPIAAGEPVAVITADDVIAALGDDLEVTDVRAVDLDGVAATRFDVEIPATASCSTAAPCEVALRTSSGQVKLLSATQTHRIWWINDGADAPSMIIAMAPRGNDFIERSTQLLSTMSRSS